MTSPLTIGTFGLGCVGQGFLELLNGDDATAHVKHICVKERGRERATGSARLTYEALDILGDEEVGAIVELTSDPALALEVIVHALRTGRDAITAGKKVVAENLAALIDLQRATGRSLLYEASCAASIPVLHALETHFAGEHIQRLDGILNSTTNYILTRMEEGADPAEALWQAQRNGFAEADPTSDLSGADARYKLVILLAHAFGTVVRPAEVLCHGIEGLAPADLAFGRERGWRVRSVASARRCDGGLLAHVLPTFVEAGDPFALVRDEYNAVRIGGEHSGVHVLQGKGAGKLPTGLAVLGDVRQLRRGGGYAYARVHAQAPKLSAGEERIHVYVRMPVTHQELLGAFEEVRPVDRREGWVRATGAIPLTGLHQLVGEGREGFQVIALPHLSERNQTR